MLSSAETLEKSWKDTARHPHVSQGWKRCFCQCTNSPFLSLANPENQKCSGEKSVVRGYPETGDKPTPQAWIGNHTTGNHMLRMTTARSSGPHPSRFRSNRLSLTSLARTPLSSNSSWKTPPWCPTYWNARIGSRHKFGLVTTFPY